MKNDWNARACENPRWYINTVKRTQSDQEFDEGGVREVEALVVADLPFLTRGRDPRSLRLLETVRDRLLSLAEARSEATERKGTAAR